MIKLKKQRWPFITGEDKKAVLRVLKRGILFGHKSPGEKLAPEVTGFEKEFAGFVGTQYAMLVSSGTAALHTALVACGVGEGDEVISTALSYVATPMAIMHAGAKPVFVDININTHNIDVDKIERKITRRTKAILPVHMDGLVCDMDEINRVAKKHDLAVIEDCARAHGSTYKGRIAGTMGDAAGFSVNGTKTLSVGEGGVFVTNSKKIYEKAKFVATMTAGPGEQFNDIDSPDNYPDVISYTYKTTELTGAMARSKLKLLTWVNSNSKRNCDFLDNKLSFIPLLITQAVYKDRFNPHYRYRIRLNTELLPADSKPREIRNRLMKFLSLRKVDVSFDQLWPLPSLPAFKKLDYNEKEFSRTKLLLESSFTLGNDTFPVFAQPFEVIKYYAEMLRKAAGQI